MLVCELEALALLDLYAEHHCTESKLEEFGDCRDRLADNSCDRGDVEDWLLVASAIYGAIAEQNKEVEEVLVLRERQFGGRRHRLEAGGSRVLGLGLYIIQVNLTHHTLVPRGFGDSNRVVTI